MRGRGRRIAGLVTAAACVAAVTPLPAPARPGPSIRPMGGGTVVAEPPGSGEPAPLVLRQAPARDPEQYPFYPQAGTLWGDVYPVNFVDVEPSAGISDWNCTSYTYDGHRGHDTDIASFKVQAVGVPVFAALDGTVTHTNDGQDDDHTGPSEEIGNFVALDHGDGHRSFYFHLKKGSVLVAPGDVVRAGQQLGLVGSSGNSTWPHLHFESHLDGVPYEPSAGACRPGASYWVHQPDIPVTPVVREVIFTERPLEGAARLPWDEARRTGTVRKDTGTFYVRVQMSSTRPNSTYDLSFLRPGGRVASSYSGSFENDQILRASWFWWAVRAPLTTGSWTFRLKVNGKRVAQVPLKVVGPAARIVNHPPRPVKAQVLSTGDAADDALVCRVTRPTLVRDYDYDLVRYAYVWTVDGAIVREATSAALSDMLPAGTASPASAVSCDVTPSDGRASGPTTRNLL